VLAILSLKLIIASYVVRLNKKKAVVMEKIQVVQGTVTQLKTPESLNVSLSCNDSCNDMFSCTSQKENIDCMQESCIIKSDVPVSVLEGYTEKVEEFSVSTAKSEKHTDSFHNDEVSFEILSDESTKDTSITLLNKLKTLPLAVSSTKKKKKKKKRITICTSMCRYESVRRVARRLGFKEVEDISDWTIFWTDYSVTLERVMDMKRFQKINHFPGMTEICRKDFLARNLNRLQKLFPKDYNCFPKSWCLPADYNDFQAYCRTKKNKTFICKPETGCQGKGIFLTKSIKDIKHGEHMICQQYITKCLLIDGFKFDLRLYVLVTSCDPLRIFMFKEGLGRFATKKYQEPNNNNMDEVCMHLTNYAINKNSSDFIRDDNTGSKRTIQAVCEWLIENGYDVNKMWSNIDDVVIKTLISCQPILKHNYRTCFPNHNVGSACFEILGFDVMLDNKMKAWVLEVNHSPSFHTDAKLDKIVKEGLLTDTFNLLHLRSIDKKKCLEEDKRRIKERLINKPKSRETKQEEIKQVHAEYLLKLEKYEDENMGGFRRIYPPLKGVENKYAKYFNNSSSLFQTTAAQKAREQASRQLREELRLKKEKMDSYLKKLHSYKKDAGESQQEEKKKPKRPKVSTKVLVHRTTAKYSSSNIPTFQKPPASHLPSSIVEEEEVLRLKLMVERERLVKSSGVTQMVYNLLTSNNIPSRYNFLHSVAKITSGLNRHTYRTTSDNGDYGKKHRHRASSYFTCAALQTQQEIQKPEHKTKIDYCQTILDYNHSKQFLTSLPSNQFQFSSRYHNDDLVVHGRHNFIQKVSMSQQDLRKPNFVQLHSFRKSFNQGKLKTNSCVSGKHIIKNTQKSDLKIMSSSLSGIGKKLKKF